MKKDWFKVEYNVKTQHEYFVQIRHEATKNHKETDKPLNSSVMPKNKEERQCPVRSFKIHYSHLNPDNDYLWQYPNLKSEIWYT